MYKKLFNKKNQTQSETPLINKAGKNNPFIVPDGYFEKFEQQIMQKIKHIKPYTPTEIFLKDLSSFIFQPYAAASLSAVIVITALCMLFLYTPYQSTENSHKKTIPTETIIIINENIPENKLFIANIEKKSDKTIAVIQISPLLSKDYIEKYASAYHVPFSVVEEIRFSLEQYAEKNKLKEKYSPAVQTHQEHIAQIRQKHPETHTGTQQIEQEHPQYVSTPQHTSEIPVSVLASEQDNIVDIIKEVTSQPKTVTKKQDIINIPYYTLPDVVCSETACELKPSEINKKFRYVWSTGEQTPSIHVSTSGIYTLTIYYSEAPGKFVTSTSLVKIIPKPSINLPSYLALCSGSSLKIEPDVENPELYKYLWLPTMDTTKNITVDKQGLYVLSIQGCNSYFDSVLVIKEHCDIVLPNVITPNGDGLNDYFYIRGFEKYPNTLLKIYSRNGNIVFTTENYQNNWDGGNLPGGTYFYIMRFSDGIEKHGTITIMR